MDTNALLDAAVDTNELETSITPIPLGIFPATVKSYEPKTFAAKEPGKPDINIIEATLIVNDPAVAEEIGRDQPTSRHTMFMNIDPATGTLSADNVGLGRFLEACGAKELGSVPLREALDSTVGAEVAATITHRLVNEETYDQVSKVQDTSYLGDVEEAA